MILCKGGANEPYDMRLPGKAGGAVAGRRDCQEFRAERAVQLTKPWLV